MTDSAWTILRWAGQFHKCVFKGSRAGLDAKLGGRSLGDQPPARDDHYFVTQRAYLGEHVAGEHHAILRNPAAASADRAADRTVGTSSPLVGSSSSRFLGECKMALPRAVFIASPWENPAVRREAIDSRPRVETTWSTLSDSSLGGIPRSFPKYTRFSRTVNRE